ncbi:hypothetical protein TBLA_0I00610 [Henningerozyma blattae CBS 6284]|uniref:Peroxisomal hydratase-dehydrogenase-epimerase n=1 Tax=Henningerozyma blattae (strain ATCC 34711 / CBS 6284 / DSM 70876 / NBRC 10599 / NRRL Y-10934 / UCD 77-7) TaxID=1071380 RepID=I2H8L8_HENB6|nr:hypothetical protein TBLA_0I00610 [Tetrapisispora blattae CBS 6284]CCH62720.1 hypothetical protein TBLA_0I00610 [Tetrapisispora blattae CBS 6284]
MVNDKKLLFKDRVVVITGGGGGLGKVYAIEFAKRGAKVVVNDLGGSVEGSGKKSASPADVVVKEIVDKYRGTAVANYNSVTTEGKEIIQTAIKNYGRVDILINNAGILRDVSFARMSPEQFNSVIDVHLNGAYQLTKAAWPYMRDQRYGRIINTASPAGLYGNYGQANYSAAKLGLVGLGETLAKEGYKYNITVNSIAPLARSRMTEGVIPPHILQQLGPEKIAPLVLYLTHESTKITNSIFELAAGYFGQIRWERSSGQIFNPNSETFTPEAVLHRWSSVVDFKHDKPFKGVEHPNQLADYNKLITAAKQLPDSNPQGPVNINSLKGKIVIVTGAGSGLGRSHALWFARYGSKVVVNDLSDPQCVVDEINSLYGKGEIVAIKDIHNVVTESKEIIETALQKFGRVDVLVNNAGILRDRSFLKMSDAEWDMVLKVHLYSTFNMCKAVWPVFLKQHSGFILNTTSTSGIYGNFGQANYAAAKAAILGFSRTLAIEGLKKNIIVNAIAPHAETAMTKTIFSEKELANHFDPSQVSPFVVLLCSKELQKKQESGKLVTGQLFEVGGGWCGQTRWQRSPGFVSLSEQITPEIIRDNFSKITDFPAPTSTHPNSTQESSMSILQSVQNAQYKANSDLIFDYNYKDCILYNLGIGCDTSQMKYVYENDPEFQVLPTFGVVPSLNSSGQLGLDKLVDNFNYSMLLHGEQYLHLFQSPMKTSARLRTVAKPVQVIEKAHKAAIVVGGFKTYDVDTNELVAYNEGTYFIRGASVPEGKVIPGTNRPSFAIQQFVAPVDKSPDYEFEVVTDENQALIYRLSGDFNPLHIDSKLAKAVKFPKPILHGLCTLGISCKVLLEKFGAFSELKVRFTNVVFPGDKLKVRAWKVRSRIVIFQTIDVSRGGIVVLDNAAIKLSEPESKL